jgi:flavodoxin short chain
MNAAVIYWSGTGNTEAMANAVAEGAGVTAQNVSSVSASDAAAFDVLLLGCPAMGAEELEETEFEPFFAELEGSLTGKKVGIFGSYGWGDGEWIRLWADRVKAAGAELIEEPLMINEAPDGDGLAKCRAFGEAARA